MLIVPSLHIGADAGHGSERDLAAPLCVRSCRIVELSEDNLHSLDGQWARPISDVASLRCSARQACNHVLSHRRCLFLCRCRSFGVARIHCVAKTEDVGITRMSERIGIDLHPAAFCGEWAGLKEARCRLWRADMDHVELIGLSLFAPVSLEMRKGSGTRPKIKWSSLSRARTCRHDRMAMAGSRRSPFGRKGQHGAACT